MKEPSPEYRKLTVSAVRECGEKNERMEIKFSDSIVSFSVEKSWLLEHGIKPTDITPGREVFIQGYGPNGNQDCMLASPNPLNDLRLVA